MIYFPLSKDGVQGFLKVWDGVIEAHKATIGRLIEVDWGPQITSFFGMIRIKVPVRDPTKIPLERLMEMGKKLY